MPGPIQSGISNILSTAAVIAGGAKHIEEEKAQTAEQKSTTEATNQLKLAQEAQAQQDEADAELEYKGRLVAGMQADDQAIYEEEINNVLKEIEPKIDYREHLNMDDEDIINQAATEVGTAAMARIAQLNQDPFRQLARAYVNGDIPNRQEYERQFNQIYLRKSTPKNAKNNIPTETINPSIDDIFGLLTKNIKSRR